MCNNDSVKYTYAFVLELDAEGWCSKEPTIRLKISRLLTLASYYELNLNKVMEKNLNANREVKRFLMFHSCFMCKSFDPLERAVAGALTPDQEDIDFLLLPKEGVGVFLKMFNADEIKVDVEPVRVAFCLYPKDDFRKQPCEVIDTRWHVNVNVSIVDFLKKYPVLKMRRQNGYK